MLHYCCSHDGEERPLETLPEALAAIKLIGSSWPARFPHTPVSASYTALLPGKTSPRQGSIIDVMKAPEYHVALRVFEIRRSADIG